jgi:hypothetical protein
VTLKYRIVGPYVAMQINAGERTRARPRQRILRAVDSLSVRASYLESQRGVHVLDRTTCQLLHVRAKSRSFFFFLDRSRARGAGANI